MHSSTLKATGYNNKLQNTEKTVAKKRSRSRNEIWFNLPWNDEVITNVAKKFLSMIDRHFPKGFSLGKDFNRSTVKVSYSSMPNMAQINSGHNKKVTRSSTHMETKGSNCRSQPCPLSSGELWRPLASHQAVHRTHFKHIQGEVHWT